MLLNIQKLPQLPQSLLYTCGTTIVPLRTAIQELIGSKRQLVGSAFRFTPRSSESLFSRLSCHSAIPAEPLWISQSFSEMCHTSRAFFFRIRGSAFLNRAGVAFPSNPALPQEFFSHPSVFSIASQPRVLRPIAAPPKMCVLIDDFGISSSDDEVEVIEKPACASTIVISDDDVPSNNSPPNISEPCVGRIETVSGLAAAVNLENLIFSCDEGNNEAVYVSSSS